jgi:hypothetical protein
MTILRRTVLLTYRTAIKKKRILMMNYLVSLPLPLQVLRTLWHRPGDLQYTLIAGSVKDTNLTTSSQKL